MARHHAHTRVEQPKDGLYDTALAESEREAVAELLQYLENVRMQSSCLVGAPG